MLAARATLAGLVCVLLAACTGGNVNGSDVSASSSASTNSFRGDEGNALPPDLKSTSSLRRSALDRFS